jgi:hypothetical protein
MHAAHRHPAVLAAMAAQHGVITRAQAIAAGLSPDDLARALRSGEWVTPRRGFHVTGEHWSSLDVHVGRPRLEARVAWMGLRADYVISHNSAAAFQGVATLRQPTPLVHVTRLGAPRARTQHGIKRHQSRVLDEHVVQLEGLPMLGPARTAIDIAREHGLQPGVVAMDSARQLGVGIDELWGTTECMWRWPDITTARAAIELSNDRAESPGETLTRLLLVELGLGPIQPQFEIRDGVRWARCDLRVGRHLFEFDGFKKYLRRDMGGLAVDPDRVVWEEKQRQDWLLGYQLGMSRLIWADFWGDRRRAARQRVAREYQLTCARFGTSIDDLAHVIVGHAA